LIPVSGSLLWLFPHRQVQSVALVFWDWGHGFAFACCGLFRSRLPALIFLVMFLFLPHEQSLLDPLDLSIARGSSFGALEWRSVVCSWCTCRVLRRQPDFVCSVPVVAFSVSHYRPDIFHLCATKFSDFSYPLKTWSFRHSSVLQARCHGLSPSASVAAPRSSLRFLSPRVNFTDSGVPSGQALTF
jgi:hypothetical protein